MKTLKALIGGGIIACAAATSMNASASIYDYSGSYSMDCNSASRMIGVAFAYGEIEPTDGAVLLNNADSRGEYWITEYETCDEFSFDDIDQDSINEFYTKAKAKCMATDMPITGFVKDAVCSLAAGSARDSLEDSTFPNGQDYIASYVMNNLGVNVSCSLIFFSWCLQYGTNSVYSFEDGNAFYYHAYINNAGKWMESFALSNVIQKPNLPCMSMRQAILNADAAASGTVATAMDLLDGHTCVVANPFNPGEAISVVLGIDVKINQTGAE